MSSDLIATSAMAILVALAAFAVSTIIGVLIGWSGLRHPGERRPREAPSEPRVRRRLPFG